MMLLWASILCATTTTWSSLNFLILCTSRPPAKLHQVHWAKLPTYTERKLGRNRNCSKREPKLNGKWCRFRPTEDQDRSKMMLKPNSDTWWNKSTRESKYRQCTGKCTKKGVDGCVLTRSCCQEDEMRKSRPSWPQMPPTPLSGENILHDNITYKLSCVLWCS